MSQAKPITFAEHKETTAKDLETIAAEIVKLAAQVREGDLGAFQCFWIEGGTEEGDAKINALREIMVIRFFHRQERLA